MAIDNLHSRCIDGIKRIKDEAKNQDKFNEKPDKKKEAEHQTTKPRANKEGKDGKDGGNHEDVTDNYQMKCKKKSLFYIFQAIRPFSN
jgi:Sec-independent protein translocase protein TatA